MQQAHSLEMKNKILKSVGLIVFNVIGFCVGIAIGLIIIEDLSDTQDNHFLGGLVSLFVMVGGMFLGIAVGVGTTLLISVFYIIINRKNF